MTIRGRLLAGICIFGPLAGCGYERDTLAALPHTRQSSVVLASPTAVAKAEVVPGSYIVTFRAPRGTASRGYASFLAEAATQYSWLDATYLSDPRVKSIRYITTVDLGNPRDLQQSNDFDAPPGLRLAWDESRLSELAAAITEVSFASAADAPAVLHAWEDAGVIWFAEPNYTSQLDGTGDAYVGKAGLAQAADGSAKQAGQQLTQDEIAATLEVADYKAAAEAGGDFWWHQAIHLSEAMEFATQMELSAIETPIVAVLDSGVDYKNPGLDGRIWVNPTPGASGCLDDVNGCDTTVAQKAVLGSGSVFPFATAAAGTACPAEAEAVCPHGTHVSGIIAAKIDQSTGIGGVCPVCRIMAIKIIKNIGGKGSASDDAILNGLKYLTLFRKEATKGDKHGIVRVANASFGKASRSRAVAVVVSVLRKPPNEVLIVGAAGNEDTMWRSYPAALTDAIAVAALAEDRAKAKYSNFGPWVDVAAPGGDSASGPQINSTVPGPKLIGFKQGTSMAAPVVSGVAGLILALDPGRSFEALRGSIVRTADPSIYQDDVREGLNYNYYFIKPQGDTRRLPLLGAGEIDAKAAIENTELNRGYLIGASPRVDNQCGTVANAAVGRDIEGGGTALLFALLLLPLAATTTALSEARASRRRRES